MRRVDKTGFCSSHIQLTGVGAEQVERLTNQINLLAGTHNKEG
jgi:hypothetical protein